jgi:hypothetical protein
VLTNAAISAAQAYLNTFPPNSSSQQFIRASSYLSYLQLIGKNLAQGQSPQTIVTKGGDLCLIAATYYLDASLGFALARANGLIGPDLSSDTVYQINLPPASALTG